jgi:hypothetical protein
MRSQQVNDKMPAPILPRIGPDLSQWGRQLNAYLQTNLGKLYFKTDDDNASEDGILLWDRSKKYVVVSLDDAFRQVATRQATPSASTGSVGDVAGMVAWDTNYIYICTANYDGTTAIWKRVQLTTW